MTRAYQLASALLVLASACAPAKPSSSVPQPPGTGPTGPAINADEGWRAQKPGAGQPGKLDYPVAEHAKLNSGLALYVLRRPGGVAQLSIVSRHGAGSVPPGKSGLAALTARMLTEGTKTKSSQELAEATEALGSSLGDDAGRDYTTVELTTLREDLARGLELLAEVVKTPAFRKEELERVRGEWLDGLVAERQQPARIASLVGLRVLLGNDYGAPVGGSVPDVKRLTVQDLIEFHRRAFAPQNLALVVAGEATLAEVRPHAERLFGSWKGLPAPEPKATPPAAPAGTRIVMVDRPGAVQTALFAAQAFPKRSDPGHEARLILSQVLGGLFTSRINQNLREKHAYTYGARSQAIATRSWGAFVVSTSVKTQVTAEAVSELVSEIKAMKDPAAGRPLGDDELLRARADLVNSVGAHLEHNSRVADDLLALFVYQLKDDYYAKYTDLIAAVDRNAVTHEAQGLQPEQLLIVAVGDRSAIETALRSRGFKLESADPRTLE
jgi:zinc protease